MKKIILLTFVIALIVVNVAAWLVAYFSGFTISLAFRIPLIIGIVFIATVFSGAAALVNKAETEKPNNQS